MASSADNEDYYDALGVEPTATLKEITKAYRMLALRYHPDKNPDKPDIVQLFHRITKAYDVLTDPKAKDAYDAVIRIQLDRKKRLSEMDEQRRKLREDLIERESAGKDQQILAQQRLKQELERLKEESAARQRQHEDEIQEMFFRRRQQQTTNSASSAAEALSSVQPQSNIGSAVDNESLPDIDRSVKIRWKKDRYQLDEQKLRQLIQPYGPVEHIVISSKMNSAIVVFKSILSANQLVKRTNNLEEFDSVEWAAGGQEPLALKRIMKEQQEKQTVKETVKDKGIAEPALYQQQHNNDQLDYETSTLLRLQQIAKRKREICLKNR